MRPQNSLQQRAIHVLVEDIHVAQPVSAEATPHVDLDWMRILVDTIGWIERLPLRPANEYLTPEALAPEDLLIGEHHLHPLGSSPTFVAFSECEPLALLLFTELLLMPSDTTEETHLNEPTVDGSRGDIEAELATDAARCGKLCCLCLSDDRCILLSSRLPLATAVRRVVRIFLR